MPDKRDMHQAKSHRSGKNKHRNDPPRGKVRAQASMPGATGAAMASEDGTPMSVPVGKKNKSRH
jgi:hypothetical protein